MIYLSVGAPWKNRYIFKECGDEIIDNDFNSNSDLDSDSNSDSDSDLNKDKDDIDIGIKKRRKKTIRGDIEVQIRTTFEEESKGFIYSNGDVELLTILPLKDYIDGIVAYRVDSLDEDVCIPSIIQRDSEANTDTDVRFVRIIGKGVSVYTEDGNRDGNKDGNENEDPIMIKGDLLLKLKIATSIL